VISIEGDDEGSPEALRMLRLTCLEQGLSIDGAKSAVPRVRAEGTGLAVT
jgi:hypothetical protein